MGLTPEVPVVQPSFADHGAQEQIIETRGNAQLLYKRGMKVMRWRKTIWGWGQWKEDKYAHIKPYLTGAILEIGLGMGNSTDTALERGEVTKLVSYEIEQDIVDLWRSQNPTIDLRHTINVKDIFRERMPRGPWNVILYDLELDSQLVYDQAVVWIPVAAVEVPVRGAFILPVKRNTYALINEVLKTYRHTVVSSVTGRKPEPLFVVSEKQS